MVKRKILLLPLRPTLKPRRSPASGSPCQAGPHSPADLLEVQIDAQALAQTLDSKLDTAVLKSIC